MHIKRIRVKNFKSFADLDIHFDDLNYFVGANASGKSNFINIFQFLRNIANHGLENAISMEGGVEYLRNMNMEETKHLTISVAYKSARLDLVYALEHGDDISSRVTQAEYSFQIEFHSRNKDFRIVEDKLCFQYEFFKWDSSTEYKIEQKIIGRGESTLINNNGTIETNIEIPPNIEVKFDKTLKFILSERGIDRNKLFLETDYFSLAHGFDEPFKNIAIYDFDPKLSKRASSITGLKELEEDGSNLAIVLKNIIENKRNNRKFFNLLNDILPFVDNFKVQRFADKSILFMMSEEYNSSEVYIPATFISDGTINLIALIIALYFEDKGPIIFEEPERNIHPHLIANLVNMFEDVSRHKQIIITTHNPEIVRHAKKENLLLVARDTKGFSTIRKPVDNQDVQHFLENEIGMEELYIQNLLGGFGVE